MPRLSKIGAAALAAFGWTSGSAVTASYLQVAGGGGGCSAGGGAGGYLTGTTTLNPTLSYTVIVGAGGPRGTTASATNGSNSQFGTLTASVGGGGSGYQNNGSAGGSGGGGGGSGSTTTGGAGTSGQGNAGGGNAGITAPNYPGGGGGGAGAAGGNASGSTGGSGGVGLASSISGTSTYYAGGGGAASGGTAGTGGLGGGGNGSNSTTGSPGTENTGGGGGGGSGPSGGNGGSGVVIISYPSPQKFGGGVVTSSGGNTIHTFTTSGTLSPLSSLTASYLIVAGGGGGSIGGGGAGGLLTGSGVTIDTNSTYLVTVGAGGAGATTDGQSSSGANSSFSMVATTAVGGGGAGGYSTTAGLRDGLSGGSGGGGGARSGVGSGTGGAATSGQGNIGGNGFNNGVGGSPGGGGGGAGAVGGNGANVSIGGNGGIGLASSISGTSTYYAGGGGGGATGTQGTGGLGGGGAGVASGTPNAGTANRGGGGGGNFNIPPDVGGAGGSGVVIISYAGSTQQMAGGTVTVAGGNVIHTFTSSGYLTPIVLVNKSLRFRSSASAYLNRTFKTPTSSQKFTWSGWIKRGKLDSSGLQGIFAPYSSGTVYGYIAWYQDGIRVYDRLSGGTNYLLQTTAVYRDPAAWYHIVVAVDTTQATASNRVRLYVNGVEVTAFSSSTYPTQNNSTTTNSAIAHNIGYDPSNTGYLDGYQTEINFIDGQALTPNSFGTFNGLGVWQPIRYGGSYGTNGFYLPFTNTTSTTTLVADSSPNGNNWTPNNISLTAGSTYDSMTDVPTLTSATAANTCTLNPVRNTSSGLGTFSNGNLKINGTQGTINCQAAGTMAFSGKMYCEITIEVRGNDTTTAGVGIVPIISSQAATAGNMTTGIYYIVSGNKRVTGSTTSYGSSYTTGDVIGIAVDTAAETVTFYKNNVSQGSISGTGVISAGVLPYIGFQDSGSPIITCNFGQQPFSYTPPTGFVALNTFNLSTPTIGATASTTANKYMDISLYTGNASALTVSGLGFSPDLVWIKPRNLAYQHQWYDQVRGALKRIGSSSSNAENTETETLKTFTSNGFTLGNDVGTNPASPVVAWNWNAGGSTVTNTSGSISSQVRANTTAGFSIVTYTGNEVSGATVGHGLGVAPKMMIIKSRSTAQNWPVYHISTGNTGSCLLNLTNAFVTAAGNFNNTTPSSSVFTLGGGSQADRFNTNKNGDNYVAYCFAEVAGYSAFGSYTGNGSSDGPFVFTGFRPRFIMVKGSSDSDRAWVMIDTSRNTANVMNLNLYANASDAEATDTRADGLSNGFKVRGTGTWVNNSASTYIYMAFAENPFKYANAR
jgi:hypothetical protein